MSSKTRSRSGSIDDARVVDDVKEAIDDHDDEEAEGGVENDQRRR